MHPSVRHQPEDVQLQWHASQALNLDSVQADKDSHHPFWFYHDFFELAKSRGTRQRVLRKFRCRVPRERASSKKSW